MKHGIQLNLLNPLFIDDEFDINYLSEQHLLTYLDTMYPDMRFKLINNYFSDNSGIITQSISKKSELYFHINKYYKSKNKFIGYTYGRNYGDYHHHSGPISSINEFKEKLPNIISAAKTYIYP